MQKKFPLINILLVIFIIAGSTFYLKDYIKPAKILTNSEEMQQFLESDEVTSVMLANIAKDVKDPNKAKEMTEEAIKNIPEESKYKLYYNLANTFFASKKYAETFDYASKAIALEPKCDICYNLRGLANMYLKKLQASLTDFNTAIKIKEDAIY